MKAEDFAAWLSAISGMSEGQRREAMAALEKASVVGGAPGASAKKGGKRSRQEDALGRTGVERVAAQGCPHCAGREVVGWGRSDGLLRFRCKACGRTFNALTKTPMAHLRKKEKWLEHARAMIEGKSLAKTAALCGVHPTTAFRWRHRFLRAPASDKPRGLRGIVEADETFILEILQGALVRPAEKGAKARRNGQASGPLSGQHSHPCRARPERRHLRCNPASGRRRFGKPRPGGNCHAGQSSHRRWRQGDRHFRPQSRDSLPRRAGAGKADTRGASSAHQQRQRLPQPSQAMAQPLQRRRHQEPAQLSRLAPRSRSLGRQTRTAKLDQRRYRRRTLPTDNAIRAKLFFAKIRSLCYLCRVAEERRARACWRSRRRRRFLPGVAASH